jgi:hypothetical protein
MARLCIIAETDPVWGLSAWERAIPVLRQRGHEIVGIWECPAILPKLRGYQVPLWYLKTFGPAPFSTIVLFALLARSRRALLSRSGRCAADFAALARRHAAYYQETSSPNDPHFVEWVGSNQIDILLVTASFVLKKAIIEAPRFGCINKHAAALPCNRGLFPYFWARLHGTSQGVSYHQVVEAIDEGPLLHQRTDFNEHQLSSMVSFYLEVFSRLPVDIACAVDARLHGAYIEPSIGLAPSYFGLPTRADYRRFRAVGGRVTRLADLKGALQLC